MRALDYQRGARRPGSGELVGELVGAGLGRARTFYEGEPVLTNGVPTRHAALIINGLLKVMLPSAEPDKAGILLSIRGPGDLVGEETAILGEASPDGYGHSAGGLVVTALTVVSVRVFPAEQLHRFLSDHPAFLWPVAAALCERLADAEARIASAARDNADSRLARLLCDLERHGVPDDGRVVGWRPVPESRFISAMLSLLPGLVPAGKPLTGSSRAGAPAGSSPPDTAPSCARYPDPCPYSWCPDPPSGLELAGHTRHGSCLTFSVAKWCVSGRRTHPARSRSYSRHTTRSSESPV